LGDLWNQVDHHPFIAAVSRQQHRLINRGELSEGGFPVVAKKPWLKRIDQKRAPNHPGGSCGYEAGSGCCYVTYAVG